MSKIETREEVFPFECGHPRCDKVYDIGQFKEIALLWGFIYLTCGEFDLIGLTCPDCHFTTINKYKSFAPDFSIERLQDYNAPIDFLGKTISSNFNFFVPFSEGIIVDSNLLAAKSLSEEYNDGIKYRLPQLIQPRVHYPEKIRQEFPFSLAEELIQELCKLVCVSR